MHRRSVIRAVLAACCLPILIGTARAATNPPETPATSISRATSPIRVDGVLDERAWQDAARIDTFYEIDPGDNVAPPVRTDCLVTYDEGTLYVGFRCEDPDPSRIRARLVDRDRIEDDDVVGFAVDTFGDGIRAWQFLANPAGVQSDVLRNEVGKDEDASWDAIWDAAGRVDDHGYVVEFAVPMTALRFPRGDGPQTWGFLALRLYPRRFRYQIANIPLDRNRNCITCQYARISGIEAARPGRNIELDPTWTALRSDQGEGNGLTQHGKVRGDAGLSLRWGVTPNVVLNAAINPDFSQVEADAAQLNVNTRYALYYPEKRPFFQEGADLFETGIQAVHTRTVADPSWGAKLSGTEGDNTIGFFGTRDERNNLLFPSNAGTGSGSLDQQVSTGVMRYRRDLGGSSTLGLLGTSRSGLDYFNRVYGLDGNIRLTRTEKVSVQVLQSDTRYPDAVASDRGQPRGAFAGRAAQVGYEHASRNWRWGTEYAGFGRQFRADAGYLPRVDTRSYGAELTRNFLGGGKHWWAAAEAGAEASVITDQAGRKTDQEIALNGELRGPRQSYAELRGTYFEELYAGTLYTGSKGTFRAGGHPTDAFDFWGAITLGDGLDYANGRIAGRIWGGPGFSYRFGPHFTFWIDHTIDRLQLGGKRIMQANLVQTSLIYQFNVRTFTRLILQYTDERFNRGMYRPEIRAQVPAGSRDLFGQFLFSYKINPQTVFYLGGTQSMNGTWLSEMRASERSLFTKIGYAWMM